MQAEILFIGFSEGEAEANNIHLLSLLRFNNHSASLYVTLCAMALKAFSSFVSNSRGEYMMFMSTRTKNEMFKGM